MEAQKGSAGKPGFNEEGLLVGWEGSLEMVLELKEMGLRGEVLYSGDEGETEKAGRWEGA